MNPSATDDKAAGATQPAVSGIAVPVLNQVSFYLSIYSQFTLNLFLISGLKMIKRIERIETVR